ncbi:solute carrier family 15 member 2 isoform X1 [Daphnia magna]|uniref:solute carrier family 15 member 2 isoform X1 n=1 Tax=Daphnia magna TaxID=35525 RepID=UPI001E1BDCA8|nr:solute carrier family 15 member 2 isoform X1 [Daphnia magna]
MDLSSSNLETLALIGKCKDNTEGKNDAKKHKYPVAVFFIVVNEFCERFSYYGMKTVLTLYLRDVLLFDENDSTIWYHLFSMLCYFTPVFGAILADTYLGKFKTILYLSCLYACGNVLLSVASIPNTLPQKEFSLLGLFIIALGTGGIKPCVSAFGGDQFIRPQQDKQLEQFFSVFYVAINAGSLISTFVTPILREDVQCFGSNSCFPLAFGVPALLMIIAVAIFFSGKWNYKMRPAEGNVMVDVAKCVAHAVVRKIEHREEKHEHWLDFAGDKFDRQLIQDIKQVLRVLLLYVPIPVFWALFDQQGSRWTFQATRMDGTLGVTTIKPDQLQIVNPLLILALVPVFESVIYPCFKKCGLLTPLQRIGTGGLLAGFAFVVSGIVELYLEPTYPSIPDAGMTQLNFINTLPCPLNISYINNNQVKWIEINATSYSFERNLNNQSIDITAQLISSPACQQMNFTIPTWTGTIKGASTKAFSVIVTGHNSKLDLMRMENEEPLDKSSTGQPRVGFVFRQDDQVPNQGNITLKAGERIVSFTRKLIASSSLFIQTDVREIDAGTYDVFMALRNGDVIMENLIGNITVVQGGSYTIVAQQSHFNPQLMNLNNNLLLPIEVTPPSSVHMLWLVPQYFVMTVAEVMFSVTGLQFSFTQAPASMQSVMQATWLLTIAFGNLIVIIVAEAKGIPRQSMEFFLFAGLMALDMLLFFYLAANYTYVKVEEKTLVNEKVGDEGKETKVPDHSLSPIKLGTENSKTPTGTENKGFSDDTPM